MISYLPSSPSPGSNFLKVSWAITTEQSSVLSCATNKGQGMYVCSEKDDSRLPLPFFCFLGCESHVNFTAKGLL